MKSAWLIYSIWGKLVGYHEDRLTNLPEEIIIHILSFLPTKDAIRTSLLSTKWIHLWKNLTNLHFDDRSFPSSTGNEKFIKSVRRATRASNSILHTFKLNCSQPYNTDLVHSCISNAIKRKVQKLDIHYPHALSLYSSSFYNFYNGIDTNSLAELNFKMSCLVTTTTTVVYIDAPVRFSSLKILQLSEVTFTKDLFRSDSSSEVLNFSFPLLELLGLYKCKWRSAKVVNVVAPLLNSFSMTHDLLDLSSKCVVKVHGSRITKFEYSGHSMDGFVVGTLSPVIHATILIALGINEEQKLEMALLACTLLRQFSSLKYLTLSTNTIQVLARLEDLQDRLSTYDNMIHLTINVQKLPMHVKTFITLLQNFPVESLFFTSGVPCTLLQEAEFSCSLPHLRVVKFEVFNGEKCELMLAKFLLKNAKNLEEMTTIAGSDLRYCSNIEIDAEKEQVLVSPRDLEDDRTKSNAETKSTQEITKKNISNWSEYLIQFVVQLLIGVTSCLLFSYLTRLIFH